LGDSSRNAIRDEFNVRRPFLPRPFLPALAASTESSKHQLRVLLRILSCSSWYNKRPMAPIPFRLSATAGQSTLGTTAPGGTDMSSRCRPPKAGNARQATTSRLPVHLLPLGVLYLPSELNYVVFCQVTIKFYPRLLPNLPATESVWEFGTQRGSPRRSRGHLRAWHPGDRSSTSIPSFHALSPSGALSPEWQTVAPPAKQRKFPLFRCEAFAAPVSEATCPRPYTPTCPGRGRVATVPEFGNSRTPTTARPTGSSYSQQAPGVF